MKKGILATGILIIMGIGLFYFLKPTKSSIFSNKTIKTNTKAFSRTILEEDTWKKWWPGKVVVNAANDSSLFEYNGCAYKITEKRFSSLIVSITEHDTKFISELMFIPIAIDSVTMIWSSKSFQGGMNLNDKTTKINKDLETIMGAIQVFYATESNIYGLQIEKKHVVDSMLISTSVQLNTYPTTVVIYSMIDKLKSFAKANNAKEAGYPMLNIYKTDSIHYKAQVALPIDKKLQDKGDIHYRWMLGGGNILISEVKGGTYCINKALGEMEKYVTDYGRVSPAIPFQSLVTDRTVESDTSKWVTKLYWPVM